MTAAKRTVSAREIRVAAGTALVSVAALIAIAIIADHDPTLGGAAPSASAWVLTTTTLVAQSAVLLKPRSIATGGVIIAAALPVPLALASPGILFSVTVIPVVVSVFQAGLRSPMSRLRWWALGAATLIAVGQCISALGAGRADIGVVVLESIAQAVLVIGAPLVPSTLVAAQRATRLAQQETIEALARERNAQITAALARERAAMARELHDIAAHHLSGISLMASAVSKSARADPASARAGAMQIRDQSNLVLADLRRLVGLLRSSDEEDEAVKSIGTVSGLIAGAQAAGRVIDLDIRRRPGIELGDGVSALGQLAAYRMVQESLTNAARHAPGAPVEVLVDDTDPHRLTVAVQNAQPARPPAPPVASGGFGILGMRERAALTGGTFAAGRARDGGWVSRMSVPRHTNETTPQETMS